MQPVDILLIGTSHLSNPGRDQHNVEVDDVLSPHRQAEIEAVAKELGRFEPTAVAVEYPCFWGQRLDERYQKYTSGEAELGRGEDEQFGFRVAKSAGARMLAIDVEGEWYNPALEDLMAAHPELGERWTTMLEIGDKETAAESDELARITIGEMLRKLNSPESRRKALTPYMEHNLWINRVGNWTGAQMVGNWYLRNMQIAGTLDRLVEPGDRVLVIYGAGHAPLLEEFWGWNPRMRIVDPLEYLPA